MDSNQLIEMINNNLPIIAASPVVVKLIESMGNVIKTLYLPTLTYKKGKAEVDVELYKKEKTNEFFENQTFTLYEITKLKNFINTVNFAAEELNETVEFSKEPIDFDWLMRFFDAVGNISNENLQQVWAKVLAGETKSPGSVSLRTFDILRNMSQNEAQTFNELCKYILISGDCYFIHTNGFREPDSTNEKSRNIISEKGLFYSTHIIPLIECGLMSIDNSLATNFITDKVLTVFNQELAIFIIAPNDKDVTMNVDAYFLTKCGMELFNVAIQDKNFVADTHYTLACLKEMQQQYPDLEIRAYAFTGNDEEPYSDNLLD